MCVCDFICWEEKADYLWDKGPFHVNGFATFTLLNGEVWGQKKRHTHTLTTCSNYFNIWSFVLCDNDACMSLKWREVLTMMKQERGKKTNTVDVFDKFLQKMLIIWIHQTIMSDLNDRFLKKIDNRQWLIKHTVKQIQEIMSLWHLRTFRPSNNALSQ